MAYFRCDLSQDSKRDCIMGRESCVGHGKRFDNLNPSRIYGRGSGIGLERFGVVFKTAAKDCFECRHRLKRVPMTSSRH